MSKEKNKKPLKNKSKFKNKNNKINSSAAATVTYLSKKEASKNWFHFIKSEGLKGMILNTTNHLKTGKSSTMKKVERVKGMSEPVATKVVSLDCEMVSDLNDQDMLARVSLVNFKLESIYDKYVKPTSKVGDYRTRFSGIREEDLEKGEDFENVRRDVKNILYNKILVGHALHNDFKVLKFGHHKQLIRDTSRYAPFKEVSDSKSPSLKKLAKVFLNENIQEGEHNSIEDAKTAMKLYKKFRKEWEISLISSKCKKQETSQNQPQLLEI